MAFYGYNKNTPTVPLSHLPVGSHMIPAELLDYHGKPDLFVQLDRLSREAPLMALAGSTSLNEVDLAMTRDWIEERVVDDLRALSGHEAGLHPLLSWFLATSKDSLRIFGELLHVYKFPHMILEDRIVTFSKYSLSLTQDIMQDWPVDGIVNWQPKGFRRVHLELDEVINFPPTRWDFFPLLCRIPLENKSAVTLYSSKGILTGINSYHGSMSLSYGVGELL
jgi:hypothetical protein